MLVIEVSMAQEVVWKGGMPREGNATCFVFEFFFFEQAGDKDALFRPTMAFLWEGDHDAAKFVST